jgi:nicotinamide mononucleotide transporter PnuC
MSFKTLIKNEFVDGKNWFDWAFLACGLLLQCAATIFGFVKGSPESLILIISGFAGVFSVILCSQGKISSYIFGYVQLLTCVFGFSIPNHLHAETLENTMYFFTMFYGMFVWAKNYRKDAKTESIEIKSKKLGIKGNIITAIIFVVMTIACWIFLKNVPIFGALDSQPFMDSLTSVPAYIAQFFMVLGYREQYIYWFILDSFSIILAIRAGSWVMTAQFIFWTLNCFYAGYKWYKSSNNENYQLID